MPLRTPEQVVAVLAATGPRLAAVALRPGLDEPPAPGEWSAGEVVAHLWSCDVVWGGCLRRILAEDVPTIRAVNPRTWLERTDHRERGFAQHLTALHASRADLLDVLRGLGPADWDRRSVVVGAGRPVERTVLSYAVWLATHERPHLRQVERAVHAAP